MQVKKDHVQNAILKAATEEFLKYGYRKSSMRRMAESAGTRMSNFYNYFKSKDELFSYIVKDQYRLLQDSLRPIAQSDASFTFRSITDIKTLSEEIGQRMDFMEPLLTIKTVLLLACAEGTRFEHVREDFIQDVVIIIGKLCGRTPNLPLKLFVRQITDDLVSIVRADPAVPNLKQIINARICAFIAGIFIITY